MKITKERLGELLVGHGLLKPWQLAQALQEQRATKEFLGRLLVRKGWLTEDTLLGTLAEQFGLSYVRLKDEVIDWALANRCSRALLVEHDCFPLRMDSQSLTAAIADPLDAWAVSELERMAGPRTVKLVLASMQDIREAIQRAHHDALARLDDVTNPDEHRHA